MSELALEVIAKKAEGGSVLWGEMVATGVCSSRGATTLENEAGGFGVDSQRGQGT